MCLALGPAKPGPRRLVSIIFSLLFLVVRRACSSLSPRLNLFRDDPIVWRTFGLAGAARDHAAALTRPGAAAAAPGTARRLRAAVLGPHGGRPTRRPHQMPSVTWLVQSTADRQDAVDSSQLLAFWMKASGTALLAVERCSLVRVWMAAQDSCSAYRLPYFADVRINAVQRARVLSMRG